MNIFNMLCLIGIIVIIRSLVLKKGGWWGIRAPMGNVTINNHVPPEHE